MNKQAFFLNFSCRQSLDWRPVSQNGRINNPHYHIPCHVPILPICPYCLSVYFVVCSVFSFTPQSGVKVYVNGYQASYRVCESLYNKVFKDIKLMDLQFIIDTCGKNYPTLKKLKVLFNQLYDFAMKNDICNKDYSNFVDISKHKEKNPDKRDHNKFSKEEISRLWEVSADKYYQIILMLIYNGCRISEFLDLKKKI